MFAAGEAVAKVRRWQAEIDLQLSGYPILRDKGKVSALEVKLEAEAEFDKFRVHQDREYVSGFDREVRRIQGQKRRRVKPSGNDDE